MLKLGTQDISALYLGGEKIKRAYLGADVVFDSEKAASRLPDGYTEVEYVHSDANCRIDTGVAYSFASTRAVVDIEADPFLASGSEYILGRQPTGSSAQDWMVWRYSESVLRYKYSTSTQNVPLGITNSRITIDWNMPSSKLTIGDLSYTTAKGTAATSYNVCLFAYSASLKSIPAKLYSAQIYSGSTLKRDFVPCVNPSGVVGLYDLVGESFYSNLNSGTFTAGPAV